MEASPQHAPTLGTSIPRCLDEADLPRTTHDSASNWTWADEKIGRNGDEHLVGEQLITRPK